MATSSVERHSARKRHSGRMTIITQKEIGDF
jgi:hypothetical protein